MLILKKNVWRECLQQDLLKSVWKRIKSLRSQCLKWNLFSVSISCRDRHVAFPIESVGFLNLRGWISLTEKTLRSNQMWFYGHRAPLIFVVKHFWQKCCGELVFFPVHILHPPPSPEESGSTTADCAMQDWVLRPFTPSGTLQPPQDSMEPAKLWGIHCFVQAPRFCLTCGLFFVCLSCPLCSQMPSTCIS